MFNIDIDTTAVEKKLNMMSDKIKEFAEHDIPTEFHNWQAEEMRRKNPTVHQPKRRRAQRRLDQSKKYYTRIRRHSFYEMTRSMTHAKYLRRHHRPPVQTTTRPYLRQQLEQGFVKGMIELMHSKLKW